MDNSVPNDPSASHPPATLTGATIRELRPVVASDNPSFENVIRAFLPLLYGTATLLVPESPGSAVGIVVAACQSLARRWRSLPKRTVLGTWLLQTTWFIAERERRRLGLPKLVAHSPAGINHACFKKINRLRPQVLDAVILHEVLRQPLSAIATALRTKEAIAAALVERGLSKLTKGFRRVGAGIEPRAFLQAIVTPAPADIEAAVLSQWREISIKPEKSELVRAALRRWGWIRTRRVLRRAVVTLAISLGILVATAATLVWLAQQGYLTDWFLRHNNQQLAKEMPEIAASARPWPTVASQSSAIQSPPRTPADLYTLTNIWSSKLSFSAEQWNQIQPTRVRPVSMSGSDGQMVLRNPAAQRNGLAGVLGINFNWAEAELEFAGMTFHKVAARYRGNGTYINSLFGPKQSFKLDLNKFSEGQNMAGIDTLNYVNAIPDNSYMRDALAQRFFRDLGVPGPRTGFSYLSVDVPGRFTNQALGLYVLVENIDSDFANDRFGSKKVPIFKPVTPQLFADLGSNWTNYAGIYDLKTKAAPAQLQRVIQFAKLVTHGSDAEFARQLPEFVDLEEFAAFLAGHVLLSSYDGFLTNGQNYYLYLDPRSGKFGFIPWDQDHSWGEFGYIATADARERASIWEPSVYEHRFLNRVLKVDAFRAIYRRQLEQALARLFTIPRLNQQIDELAAVIRPAVAAESDFRLERFDQAISTNWLSTPRDGAPEGPKAPVHQLKRFIANRVKSVQDQLEGSAKGVVLHRYRRGR